MAGDEVILPIVMIDMSEVSLPEGIHHDCAERRRSNINLSMDTFVPAVE
jgi:hypothetical protein